MAVVLLSQPSCSAAVLLLLLVTLRIPPELLREKPTTLKATISPLDLLGLFFFLPCIICLLLALQRGGVTYCWSDARIVVLFVVSGLCLLAFLAGQGCPDAYFCNEALCRACGSLVCPAAPS